MALRAIWVEVGGQPRAVDARDVAQWAGRPADARGPARRRGGGAGADPSVDDEDARGYVAAHPRPERTGRGGVAGAQRLAALRRLATGPASRDELRVALRAVGWLAADDLDNRLRELRELADVGAGPQLAETDGRIGLVEPFPALEGNSQQALSFARAVLTGTPDLMAGSALAVLDGLVPTLARRADDTAHPPASLARRRLDAARDNQRPVRVRYWSVNSRVERTMEVLPVRYETSGAAVKALCVPVDADGARTGRDKQLALERIREVELLPGWADPQPDAAGLRRCAIRLQVTRELYDIMLERDLFGAQRGAVREVEHDVLEVEGDFPEALAWDAMEQLCAWAGVAQPLEPWWLVRAVVERLRAGRSVLEAAAPLHTVKPEVGRRFASLEEAVFEEAADAGGEPGGDGHARRLSPRR